MRRIRLRLLLTIVGWGLLAYVGETLIESKVREVAGNRRLEKAWASPADAAAEVETRRPALGDLLGRLEIPRLGISAIVAEGDQDRTLRTAIGHLPHTPLPGELGNSALAAHRDTHFRALRDVRLGDRIHVRSWSGEAEFEVIATQIVMPQDVHVLEPTPDATLTLITCYPFGYVGRAPKRFVVQARRVLPQSADAEPAATPLS